MCYGCRWTMTRLYISQKRIDSWTSENRISIEGDTMTLVELKRSFSIRPAVRILAVEGSDQDPHALVGKVKEHEELATIGADHLATSLIVDDTAYKVENGYVGDPLPKGKKRA